MIKMRLSGGSDMLIYSDHDIYKEVIGKLLRLEKIACPDNPIYLYTENMHPVVKPDAINIHKRAIKYILFDKNMEIIHSYPGTGMNMRTCINAIVKHDDDIFHYTNDFVFAKMLLIHGDKI